MRTTRYIHIAKKVMMMCCVLMLAACAVHEWPKDKVEKYSTFILHLDYNTSMPLYKDITHQMSRAGMATDYDVRYIIEVYTKQQGIPQRLVAREVFSRDDVTSLNTTHEMTLAVGNYEFLVWTDYVDANSLEDKYYNTADFKAITLRGKHEGNNDFRDAFAGRLIYEITEETTDIQMVNSRPMAKFNFISTDLERFVEHMLELKAEAEAEAEAQAEADGSNSVEPHIGGSVSDGESADGETSQTPSRVVDISEYRVVFTYVSAMPNEFNMQLNEPVWVANPGTVTFESTIKKLNDREAELGFDYVFVNGRELTINMDVSVYDKNGVQVTSLPNAVPVDLVRSKLTTIRSAFLTAQTSGGIGINPGFNPDPDGEFIYFWPPE